MLEVDPETGRQFRVEAHGGHFGGSLDAVALGLLEAPKTCHVVEFKTHSAKSFAELVVKLRGETVAFGERHFSRRLLVVVQCANVGTGPNEEIANCKIAHPRGKMEWRISLRVRHVEARRCGKIAKLLELSFGDQPDLERPKSMAFLFARRLVATSKYAGQSIHDFHE